MALVTVEGLKKAAVKEARVGLALLTIGVSEVVIRQLKNRKQRETHDRVQAEEYFRDMTMLDQR